LDLFVLFSSVSSVIRSPRLGHYAAGNAFLDAMAHYRRARKLTAISIDWGLWSDVGFIRKLGDRGPGSMRATKAMAPADALRLLEHLLERDDPQTAVWPSDFRKWAELYPSFGRTSFIRHLLEPAASPDPDVAQSGIQLARPAARDTEPASLRNHVAANVAEQLKIQAERLPMDVPLERLGFDSLLATELQARLQRDLGVRIPVLRFLGFATVQTIVDEVLARFAEQSQTRLKAARPSPSQDVADLAGTSSLPSPDPTTTSERRSAG
jgi:acyl carrier protein